MPWSQTKKGRRFKLKKSLGAPKFCRKEASWESFWYENRGNFFVSQRELPSSQGANPAENNGLFHCQRAELRINQEIFSARGEIGWPENMPQVYCILFFLFPPPFLTSPFLSFFSIPFLFLPLLPSILLASLPFIKYLSTRNFGIAMNSWLWFILSFLIRNVYFCCFVPVSPLCWLCSIKLVSLSSKYF